MKECGNLSVQRLWHTTDMVDNATLQSNQRIKTTESGDIGRLG